MISIKNIMLERYDLLQAFDELRDYQVIAVCAPAGYGKTVAVSQWINKVIGAKAIFSIDEYDNDFAAFCKRFCVALQTCQPNNKTLNEIIFHPSFQSAPDEFTLRAISALFSKKHTVIAIDDLHLIHNIEVLRLLLILIKRLPKNFQVILISRYELPLGLSDLWLKGQIARINADQLLFTTKDIIALLKKHGSNITEEQARDINQKTNGWAIGINAFLLSGGKSSDRVDYLNEFVYTNIWENWDDSIRKFMLHTANLRVLIPSLCDELTGRSDSAKLLEELAQKGAFITRQQKDIYNYHHLFQQFLGDLVQERGKNFLWPLLTKEGYWHLKQKDFHSALDCFIQCKNHDGIARCFEQLDYSNRQALFITNFFPIVKNPEIEKVMQKYPHLLILLIWRTFAEGNKDDMISFIDEYYDRYTEIILKHPTYIRELFYARLLDFRIPANEILKGNELISKLLTKLLSKLPFNSLDTRRWIIPMETPKFHRGIRDFSDIAIGDVFENIDTLVLDAGWVFGEELPMVKETLKAGILYEQGKLEEANKHAILAVAEMKSHFSVELNFCALSILVCVLDALGEKNSVEAESVLKTTLKMIEDNRAYHLLHNFSAFSMRRKIAAGDIKTAEEWLNEDIFTTPASYKTYTNITTCRAFIVTGRYDSSIILLKKILELACAFNRPLDIIETQILLAIACWKKQGFQKEAMEHLENAVRTAYPYGYVQMFVNDGTILAGMLHKLINRVKQQEKEDSKPLSFIKLLYSKARHKKELTKEITTNTAKYTSKQIAVMQLLCEGKTYKEMAEDLGIKQSTLRSHLELIYNKLEVTNMLDAMEKIRAMELTKQIDN